MDKKLEKLLDEIEKISIGKTTLIELKVNVLNLVEKSIPSADIILKNELCRYAEFYQECFCCKYAVIKCYKKKLKSSALV